MHPTGSVKSEQPTRRAGCSGRWIDEGVPSGNPESGSDELGDVVEEGLLGFGADNALHRLAVFEQDQCRDRHDLEATGDIAGLVDVELRDLQSLTLLVGNLFEDRGDHLARPTPFGPEVDEDGSAIARDGFVEGAVGEGGDGSLPWRSSFRSQR